jgi:UDP-3-O-[3-hydroxymyristoyl] glucosamine N-acyltransferase
MPELSVAEIAAATGGQLRGAGGARIRGVAPLEIARPDQLSFVANPRYQEYLAATRAGVVLLTPALTPAAPGHLTLVVVDDPHVALYRILSSLYPEQLASERVHETAVVDPTAELGEGADVGPLAVIGPGVRVGEGCRIGAHVVIGRNCSIGAGTVIHPQVTLYESVNIGERCVIHSGVRLGNDGFGYVWVDGGHRKIPQIGGCVIGDDVEIGANTNIDRGSIGDTVIGAGSKIDALVHLGHNVRLGRHVVVVAQVGISGSTAVGDGAVLAGQAGVGGHLSIGAGARIGGQAGVTADVPAGESYSGYPARPHREALRAQGLLFRLPDLLKRLRELERVVFGKRGRDDDQASNG